MSEPKGDGNALQKPKHGILESSDDACGKHLKVDFYFHQRVYNLLKNLPISPK